MATDAPTQHLSGAPRPKPPLGAKVVERRPLVFAPETSTEPNFSLLPDPSELVGMELAYREETLTRGERIATTLVSLVPSLYFYGIALGLVLPLFHRLVEPRLPASRGIGIAVGLGIFLLARRLVSREFEPLELVRVLLAPPAFAGLVYAGANLGVRRQSALVLSALALSFVHLRGSAIGQFYRDWLYAAPQLKPETRRAHPAQHPIHLRPDVSLLGVVFLAALVIPVASPMLAFLVVIGLSALALAPSAPLLSGLILLGGLATGIAWVNVVFATIALVGAMFLLCFYTPPILDIAIEVVTRFFTYGTSSTGAPGIWQPERAPTTLAANLAATSAAAGRLGTAIGALFDTTPDQRRKNARLSAGAPKGASSPTLFSLAERRLTLRLLLVVVFSALAVSLSLFFPWDVLKPDLAAYVPGARESGYAGYEMHPMGWLVFVLVRVSSGQTLYLWCVALAILLSVFVPLAVLLAVYRRPLVELAALERLIDGYRAANGEWVPGLDFDERSEWEWYVERLRSSSHEARSPGGEVVREAEHLFLGIEPVARYPILLSEKILSEHSYFLGASGAGKTARGITPLLIQLIRGHFDVRTGRFSPPPPLVILDLKGDPALLQTVKAEVERRTWYDPQTGEEKRSRMHFFTPVRGYASDLFNPFDSLSPERRSLPQLCEIVLEALELAHGPGYGRTFYTGQNRLVLLRALETMLAARSGPGRRAPRLSFPALEKTLSGVSSQEKKNALELLAAVSALTYYPQLVTTDEDLASPERVIHMPTLLRERSVAYFWLPAAEESISSRQIGRLALSALFAAARDIPPAARVQTFAVVDEFQQLVSRGFSIFQEQMRQFRIALILANQSRAALRTPDADLTDSIETSVRFSQDFAPTSHAARMQAVEASGIELAISTTRVEKHSDTLITSGTSDSNTKRKIVDEVSYAYAETLKPRFTYNDIAAIADHPLDVLTSVTRGSGYTQFAGLPFRLRATFCMSKDIYDEREREGWPAEALGRAEAELEFSHVEAQAESETVALWNEIEPKRDELLAGMRSVMEKSTRPRPGPASGSRGGKGKASPRRTK